MRLAWEDHREYIIDEYASKKTGLSISRTESMVLGLHRNSGTTCKAGFLGLSQGVTPDCNNMPTKCTKRYVQLHRGVHRLILHFSPGKFQ